MPGIPLVGCHQEVHVGRITRQNLSYREINGAVIVNMRKCSNMCIKG